ncbi:universal stress protein [Acidiferrobacter sp.]|jgi:nucleotide-binding universal stress UspA family protein|uniref:universal stress protein n=1 Tax=Acidiferrobacter sp. TaxID=1872107 RepID=UPI00261218F6|nr:universal stress protein [Acidiferrobacter sp.]
MKRGIDVYKNILVGIDGSNTSALALQEAIKIAKEQSGRLRLVHVIDVFPFTTPDTGLIEDTQLEEALFKAGQAIVEEARDEVQKAGIGVETALPQNLNHEIGVVIVEEAKRWGADLIVVGTHGRRGIQHLVLGSVAERVARAATCPLLLVPSRR